MGYQPMTFDDWWDAHGHHLETRKPLSDDYAQVVAKAAWEAALAAAGTEPVVRNADEPCSWDDPPYCETHGGYAPDGWHGVGEGKPCSKIAKEPS